MVKQGERIGHLYDAYVSVVT